MKRLAILSALIGLLAFSPTACASADESAVRQVVIDAETGLEAALGGRANVASFEQYGVGILPQ